MMRELVMTARAPLITILALAACSPQPQAPPVATPPPVAAPDPAPASWVTIHEPYAYDGDTLYATAGSFPPGLADISIRVRGIDTPEIRGKCPAEKSAAIEARDYVRALVVRGDVEIVDPDWGKYGGRVLATVLVDGHDLGALLIDRGLARPYDGGARQGWC